jgi:O-antigen ligase
MTPNLRHDPLEGSANHIGVRILTRFALALALILAAVRATMLEGVRESPLQPLDPIPPGAATTLILDLLSCIPAALVLLRRLIDREFRLHGGWVFGVWFLFASLAMLSSVWTSDRWLTLVSAPQLMSLGLLGWAVFQSVRRWDQLRVVAGWCVGLLLIFVAQGVLWRHMDWPTTVENFDRMRAEFFLQRGWESGSYAAERFEAKLRAGEIMGFSASPNTFGAAVVMLALIAVGIAIERFRRRDESGLAGLALVPVAFVIYLLIYVQSKAAWLALGGGLLLLVIATLLSRFLADRHRLFFTVGLISVLLGITTILGIGLSRGGLPEDSLNFRWRYWTGAWHVWSTSPVKGVGWAGFADHYLEHRLPVAAEEIRDPHNMLIRSASELGVIGLILLTAWMLLLAWRLTKPTAPPDVYGEAESSDPRNPISSAGEGSIVSGSTSITSLLWIGLLYIPASILASIDLSAPAAYVISESVERVLFGLLMILGMAATVLRSTKQIRIDARACQAILAALIVSCGVFLIQSQIDMAVFETGPLAVLMVVIGAALGVRAAGESLRGERLSVPGGTRVASVRRFGSGLIAMAIFGLICWIAFAIFLVIPTWIEQRKTHEADLLAANERWSEAARVYEDAYRVSLFPNHEIALRAAASWSEIPGRYPNALSWAERATENQPRSINAWLARARLTMLSAQSIPQEAIDYFARAVDLNPQDIQLRIEFAQVLETAGRFELSAEQISAALETNEAYDPTEAERLSEVQLSNLQRRLVSLRLKADAASRAN